MNPFRPDPHVGRPLASATRDGADVTGARERAAYTKIVHVSRMPCS